MEIGEKVKIPFEEGLKRLTPEQRKELGEILLSNLKNQDWCIKHRISYLNPEKSKDSLQLAREEILQEYLVAHPSYTSG